MIFIMIEEKKQDVIKRDIEETIKNGAKQVPVIAIIGCANREKAPCKNAI